MRAIPFGLALILQLAITRHVYPAPPAQQPYLDQLLARAAALNLAEQPQWHALLHYQPRWFTGPRSTIRSTDYFLSKQGWSDPAAELQATLRAFFETAEADDSAQCRYRGRYLWLRRALELQPARLPAVDCPRFAAWRDTLSADNVTLIFPSAFMNNPASMFGHTLLRLDQAGAAREVPLTAYSANFAAETAGEGGVGFALKGVFGGYYGYYGVLPYYELVKRYSDLENRDIWEYQLAFDSEEVELLAAHLWELRRTASSYYYFDENCSYQLLALLDAARPELGLRARFRSWAIPADTVRAVLESGLMQKTNFRPSAASKLRWRIHNTVPRLRETARRIARGESAIEAGTAELSSADRAQVLELAGDYLDYLWLAASAEDAAALKARSFEILKQRSGLPIPSSLPPVPVPATRPDQGHKTRRVLLASGAEDGEGFVDLGYRGTYHHLNDPTPGYHPGAQIELGDFLFRLSEEGTLRLQRLAAFDIVSLAPRDRFFAPLSWRMHGGFERKRIGDDDALLGTLDGGAGMSVELTEELWAYGLAAARVEAADEYEREYAAGPGGEGGLLLFPAAASHLTLRGSYTNFSLGDDHTSAAVEIAQTVAIGADTALILTGSRSKECRDTHNEFRAALAYYF